MEPLTKLLTMINDSTEVAQQEVAQRLPRGFSDILFPNLKLHNQYCHTLHLRELFLLCILSPPNVRSNVRNLHSFGIPMFFKKRGPPQGLFTNYVYKTRQVRQVVQKCPLLVNTYTIEKGDGWLKKKPKSCQRSL